MTAGAKTDLAPRLRFPEFRNRSGWARTKLSSVLTDHGLTSDGKSEVHSVSLTSGIVSQIEHMGRSFAATNTGHYSLVRTFDIVYTRSPLAIFKLGIVKQHKKTGNAIVSPLYGVFTPRNKHLGLIIEAYFESPHRSLHYLDPLAQKGAKNTIQLSNGRFLSGSLFLPDDENEQRKIAECLSTLDELIFGESQKLDAFKAHKKGLMQQLFPRAGETLPRLRFPEFQNAPEWEEEAVGDLIFTVTPPKKLPTSAYQSEGEFPIIDQSPDFLCGWTNNRDGVIDRQLPVIVFGDHTCTLKFVERPFVQGADGIKIFRSDQKVDIAFLFYALQANPVMQEGYKRHFSMLREKTIAYPGKESGEQQRIAACLSSLDDLIAAQSEKLEALRTHEKGLMQQLFPSLTEAEA